MESLQARFYIIDCHDSFSGISQRQDRKCLMGFRLIRLPRKFLKFSRKDKQVF
ncbi:hypothetical protein [Helicobacter rodentium]|uniref:hypothetical protein n=1 Tax=Helicobacter rodentium TaxID=59617 RepID=UPI0023542F95|nr:hypothetical protein [Helicobacter rodentium]